MNRVVKSKSKVDRLFSKWEDAMERLTTLWAEGLNK